MSVGSGVDQGGSGGDGILMASFTPWQPYHSLSHSSARLRPMDEHIGTCGGRRGRRHQRHVPHSPASTRLLVPASSSSHAPNESAQLSPEALARRKHKAERVIHPSEGVQVSWRQLAVTWGPNGLEVLELMSASSNRLSPAARSACKSKRMESDAHLLLDASEQFSP